METIKPIKRSQQLAPLSREHHDGLLFVWKLRQGLKNNTAIETLRDYSLWYWQQHIRQHFFQEEKILLPHITPANPLASQMKNEHAHIRELILQIDKEADTSTITILCDLLEKHIRFEERQLFGFLEELLNAEQMDKIFAQLEEHPLACDQAGTPGWTNEFWIRK